MSHTLHTKLEGYDERNFYHDGCEECEYRVSLGLEGVLHLDQVRLIQFWTQSIQFRDGTLDTTNWKLSHLQIQMYNFLRPVTVLMERLGVMNYIGLRLHILSLLSAQGIATLERHEAEATQQMLEGVNPYETTSSHSDTPDDEELRSGD